MNYIPTITEPISTTFFTFARRVQAGGTAGYTTGARVQTIYTDNIEAFDIVASALAVTGQNANETTREFTKQILIRIFNLLQLAPRDTVTSLPTLEASNLEGDIISIDWIFHNFRVVFYIEPKMENSNWYLVSNKNLGNINSSGSLTCDEVEKVLASLLSFAFINV